MSNVKVDIQQVLRVLCQQRICSYQYKDGTEKDRCVIDKLQLNLTNVPRGTIPTTISSLQIVVSANFKYDKDTIYPDKYEFKFEVSALFNAERHKCSWHFDFDTKTDAEYVHPFFHLTYGGKSMDGLDLGKTLLLPTPRIAYFPMDFVLGIDFILSNFMLKEQYMKLRDKKEYDSAVKNSQSRLWQPYVYTIANHWGKTINLPNSYYGCNQLLPTLID